MHIKRDAYQQEELYGIITCWIQNPNALDQMAELMLCRIAFIQLGLE